MLPCHLITLDILWKGL